jgi:2-keto-4-pentenoate hydratase
LRWGTQLLLSQSSEFFFAWLANKLSEFDIPMRVVEEILSGALFAVVEVHAGDMDMFTARFAHIGQVRVHF